MHVTNIHITTLPYRKEEVGILLESLSAEEDRLWPYENWPKMYLDKGLRLGSKGGHIPIKYVVVKIVPNELVRFKFIAPQGFEGYHQFEVKSLKNNSSELVHTINMDIEGMGIFTWYFAILHLHNALLRDLLAKAEASLGVQPNVQTWNTWVKMLRWFFSGGKTVKQKPPNNKSAAPPL